MLSKFWQTNEPPQPRISGDSTTSFPPKTRRLSGWLPYAVMQMLVIGHLSACQAPLTQPCEPPKIPKPPALSQPIPSETYSEQWRKLAEQSRLKLIDTHQTP